jgi:hypothetical protein
VRNGDGDQVADPREDWIAAEENESLDDKLAAEVSGDRGDDEVSPGVQDLEHAGALGVINGEDLDGIDPDQHGRDSGQIDGTPEDGDSFFDVVE